MELDSKRAFADRMNLERPIRLSFYSYDSLGNPWVGGGGAVRDFEILRRLTSRAQVTLIVGRYPGFKPGLREGVQVRGLGLGRGNNWLCRVTYAFAANVHVLFNRADVMGNSVSIYAPILTGLCRRGSFYQVLHHYIGIRAIKKCGPFGAISFFYERLFLRFGKNCFVLNALLGKRIARVNPKAHVELTRNGFDPGLLNLESRTASPPFILFVGRFDVYMKGLDFLIPAYAEAAAPRDVDLVMAGRACPLDLQQLNKLIPDSLRGRIRLELDVSDERKSELLASCLFFCSPSRFEGFGIAALEANAAGKAALVMDTDGFRDSLVFGETALAVPTGDVEGLKEGMRRLMDDAELRERLGRQGREHARAFSWDSIAEKEWGWIVKSFTKRCTR